MEKSKVSVAANEFTYYTKLKLNIIALIPIILLSFIFLILNNEKSSIIVVIFLALILYNVIILPLLITYINLFRYRHMNITIYDYSSIIIMPILGEVIQYLIMYVIKTNGLYASSLSLHDDISTAFFLIPAIASVIFSVISICIGKLIKFINKKKYSVK